MRNVLYLTAAAALVAGAAVAQTPGGASYLNPPQRQFFKPLKPMAETVKPFKPLPTEGSLADPFSQAAQDRRLRQQAKPIQGASSPEQQAKRDRAEARRSAAAASPFVNTPY